MTAPITGARTGGASFRVAGVPVTIHLSFLLVIGILGFGVGGFAHLLVWVLVATVAVLLHELGHALVGRMAGLSPRIDLAGFGGVTSWARSDASARSERRGWSLAISLAGPGIGFVGGAVALLLGASWGEGVPVDAGLGAFAASVWLFASFGWGILNLLPILPLDGGQALRELLPGTPAQRLQRAAVVGVVAGGALVAWALVVEQVFLALVAGWITWSNVQQVQAARARPDADLDALGAAREAARAGDAEGVLDRAAPVVAGDAPGRVRQAAAHMTIDALLHAGRHAEAWEAVRDPRLDVLLAPILLGRVLATHPDHDAVERVVRDWVDRTGDRRARGVAAVVLAAHGRTREAAATIRSGAVDAPVAVDVQERLLRDGAARSAADLGWHLLADAPEPLQSPVLAYNTACAYARAGDVPAAVQALHRARRLGFADVDQIAQDPDLAPLHDHPDWPALVGQGATTDS